MQTRGGDSRCRDVGGAGEDAGSPAQGGPVPWRTRPTREGRGLGSWALSTHPHDRRLQGGLRPQSPQGSRTAAVGAGVRACQTQRRAVLNVLASCRCQKLSHHTHSGPGRGEDGLAEPEGTKQNPVPQGCRGALSDARRLTCLSAAAVQQNAVTLKFKQRLSPGQSRSRALTVVSGPPGQSWGLGVGGVARVSTPLLSPLGLFP